ncbi:MAG: hypothetical protein D3919_09295 [Candidatus Electrothrix sp. AW5]|nr:hypothetical protein [Candidatus Electrothrix gigas]
MRIPYKTYSFLLSFLLTGYIFTEEAKSTVIQPCTRATNEVDRSGRYNFPASCFTSESGWFSPVLEENSELTTSTYWDYYTILYKDSYPTVEHAGVDIVAEIKSPVYAISPGILRRARWNSSADNTSFVMVEHYYKDNETNQVKPICVVYGHISPSVTVEDFLTSPSEGIPVNRKEVLGLVTQFASPVHLHFGVNKKHCLSIETKNFGVVPVGENPEDYGFANPFNWLATVQPSIVGFLSRESLDNEKTRTIISTFNNNGGYLEFGDPVDDGGGIFLHKWPSTDIWLQNFENGAILIGDSKDRAYSIKGSFWKWYKNFNGERELGLPINDGYNPSNNCTNCDSSILACQATKIQETNWNNHDYSLLTRQDFEKGLLLEDENGNIIFFSRNESNITLKVYSSDLKLDEEDKDIDSSEVEVLSIGKPFGDIEKSPYRDEVLQLCNMGIIKGYPDGTFRPENEVNRAELSKMVVLAVEKSLEISSDVSLSDRYYNKVRSFIPSCFKNPKPTFSDIPPEAWYFEDSANAYKQYIPTLFEIGAIDGYPVESSAEVPMFKPNRPITRAEVSKIILEAFNKTPEEDTCSSFADVEEDWYCKYIKNAVDLNIFSDSLQKYRPGDNALRGEIADMISKAIQLYRE